MSVLGRALRRLDPSPATLIGGSFARQLLALGLELVFRAFSGPQVIHRDGMLRTTGYATTQAVSS
jgi:hypothetical protein